VYKKLSAILAVTLGLFAASRAFVSYAGVKPILDAQRDAVPAELRHADEAQWLAWARDRDSKIRARLAQGDLDSMVNLLLYGTSFTRQPRISMEGEGIAQASKTGILRARVDDLVAGLRSPGANERLLFLQSFLKMQGIDATADPRRAGVFVLNNLQRVVKERMALDRAEPRPSDDPLDRGSLFQDRGLSLDTSIIPDFSIDQTLRDLKQRGLLKDGRVARVAVVGPGIEFIDKNEESAYDFYPQQTLQPFALYDSLMRLQLAKPAGLSMSIFDISGRVIDHVRRARDRAKTGASYTIQLPRDIARPWPDALVAFWRSLGDQIGSPVAPIHPPKIFAGLETRAVEVRPNVVLAFEPVDLNIVLERVDLPASERFDLIVGTNIFVYYDAFEQSLALENAGAMLKPGGLLLTNDRLPAIPGGSMQLAGTTLVPFDTPGVSARQAIGWYRKQ
jgi:hypothetical protein